MPTMHADPNIRSKVYKLLSRGFRYPTLKLFKELQSGEFLSELWDNIYSLPHLKSLETENKELTRKVQDNMAGIGFTDFEEGYVQTFDAGTPAPPCPPYEGVYRKGEPRTAIMLEISEFYKHFGLIMSQKEGKREFPDHLCAELEFLHFLTFKEAEAKEPELMKGYLLAQKDFLERHPVRWVPEFCGKLQSSASIPFYIQLAQITSMFITRDLEWVISNLED